MWHAIWSVSPLPVLIVLVDQSICFIVCDLNKLSSAFFLRKHYVALLNTLDGVDLLHVRPHFMGAIEISERFRRLPKMFFNPLVENVEDVVGIQSRVNYISVTFLAVLEHLHVQ